MNAFKRAVFAACLGVSLGACSEPSADIRLGIAGSPVARAVREHWMEPQGYIWRAVARVLSSGPTSVAEAQARGFACAADGRECTFEQGFPRLLRGTPEGQPAPQDVADLVHVRFVSAVGPDSLDIKVSEIPIALWLKRRCSPPATHSSR